MSGHASETLTIPRSRLQFSAPVTLAAAQADGGLRLFSGVAYGGGTITDHGWWDAVAFDLAGLNATAPMPLLLQHDHDRQIGVIDAVRNDGERLSISGRLFTGIDPHADSVAAKADAGAPWQLSVGIFPDVVEQLPHSGSGAVVNGRGVRAGATVFRSSRVREASFVALGADGSTHASVFDANCGPVVAKFIKEEARMADTDQAAALAAITTERDTERARADAAEAKLADLQQQFSARQRAERDAAVKELLGDAFSTESAAPYMSMDDAQFAAAQSLAKSLRSKLPPGFTAEQTSAGAGGSGADLTPEAITKYRRDHPGSSYEQAFAALTSSHAKTPQHF
jgi:hypothetical protein